MPILKLSLRAWRLSPGSQFGASLISSALLLCVALLLCLELSIQSARGRVERENRVTVFLAPGIAPDSEKKITDRITQSLGAHSETQVHSKFVSIADTMTFLRDKHPELHAELRDLGQDGESLVPRAVHLTASFDEGRLGQAIAEVKKIQGVDSVDSTESRAAAVGPAIRGLQWLLRLLTLGVAAAWILGWMALARSHAASLAGISGPMRLWGAGPWTARAPGMLAGFWVGLPAGVIAAIAYALLARPALQKLATSSALFEASAIPGASGVLMLVVTSAVAGFASGALSGSAEA
jgi:cell division protein FtsX